MKNKEQNDRISNALQELREACVEAEMPVICFLGKMNPEDYDFAALVTATQEEISRVMGGAVYEYKNDKEKLQMIEDVIMAMFTGYKLGLELLKERGDSLYENIKK